ncbi:MAG: tRNA (adenosine(37)-N6)-threonylcarbamoyltransferase complex transferase subunit TsaD [Gammaproteobacteria bacterium]|nr:tRNA (adenosine(37)-N6)-threonylcarbamoyltransferase complex transferase subunit TsaD [Gammaproteobacteria bacterium]
MKILGIETSCDETGVAVYDTARGLVAEALASQTAVHAPFGGVVPELASRDHIAKLTPMVQGVLADAGLGLGELDAVAYTAGPGLIGALMVGGSLAASLAYALGIPAVPVHHMEGHLLASMLEAEPPQFPFLALLVSGGHSMLVHVRSLGRYEIVGDTLDDAAGEAFDKVARLLSLPYPGGPQLAALATDGDPQRFAFPRPLRNQGLAFSFSGLKTAVRLAIEAEAAAPGGLTDRARADVAASFQAAVVDTLVDKCRLALEQTGLGTLVIAGGVGANRQLRERLAGLGRRLGVRVCYPRPALCTDNGAMIAYAGACRARDGDRRGSGPPRIVARPRWSLEELTPPRADVG